MSNLPPALVRLEELAHNYWWSWHPEARSLCKTLVGAAPHERRRTPGRVLQAIDPRRLEALAADPSFLEHYHRVLSEFDADMAGRRCWFPSHAPHLAGRPVGYFSAEFGVHSALPVYSGGLGILAGDIAKEASDLGVPLVGVGFMYPQGYFHQRVAADGRQEEHYRHFDRELAGAEPAAVGPGGDRGLIALDLPDRRLHIAVSRVRVGRTVLYLMDTDLEANSPRERALTARLYGGDLETRLLQECLLGIGGVRILRTLGVEPAVWHANEGHAALMMVERVREGVEAGRSFDQAVEQVRASTVFTTHTPVPAGHDAFPFPLVEKYLSVYWTTLGLDRDRFLALGSHREPWGSGFNMSALALRLSGRRNAVSRRHGEVTRRMWGPVLEAPEGSGESITTVTNGVHVPTWVAPEWDQLYRAHLGADWLERHDDPALWEGVDRISDAEIWETHGRLKTRLLEYLLERSRQCWGDERTSPAQVVACGALFEPRALTLGFARRFATYKRATLLFRQPARLRAVLTDAARPVQIVFAGKAHPADEPGKSLLQAVYRAATDPAYGGRLAFVDDYDIEAAQHLVQGVDVWLNTPRPPNEASGTSGQKASINGVPNLSVLDGWWAEAFDGTNGWAVGAPGDGPEDPEARDEADAQDLFRVLETEVVPLYYERDGRGLPLRWLKVMRRAITTIAPRFSARRMVKEYIERLYRPFWDEAVARRAGGRAARQPPGAS